MPPLSQHESTKTVKMLLMGKPGSGKCLGKDTPVLLFDGTIKNAQDIKPGDQLMGPDSRPRAVLSTNMGVGPLYRIVPLKGDPWVCNDEHVLVLKGTKEVNGEVIDLPLKDYIQQAYGDVKPGKKHTLFEAQWKLFSTGVRFASQYVEFEPYLYGLWLGDGNFRDPCITNPDKEITAYLKALNLPYGLEIRDRKLQTEEGCPQFAISGTAGKTNPFLEMIRRSTASGEKRILPEYQFNSREQRLQLLAGLIDTDGYYDAVFSVVTQYVGLRDDILFLARSLGFRATYSAKRVPAYPENVYWSLCISGNLDEIPTKIARKQAEPCRQIKDHLKTGFSVESLGEGPYFGFTLDGDGRFLLGDFTVTHNSGSLASLARDGYKLRILDLDNGLPILLGLLRQDAPDKIDNVSYETITEDDYEVSGGQMIPRNPTVYGRASALIVNGWKTETEDLGKIETWTDKDILVIDTLWALSVGAFWKSRKLNNRLNKPADRTDYGNAQQDILGMLQRLSSRTIKCNIIVSTHIDFAKDELGIQVGAPATIGQAINEAVPKYFNNVVLAKIVGQGASERRVLKLVSDGNTTIKTSFPVLPGSPFAELPIDTGLSTFFKLARGEPVAAPTKILSKAS